MNFPERLQYLVKFYKFSVRAFAAEIGVSQRTFDKQVKGEAVAGVNTVITILETFPDVSAEWLMRGKGEMLIQPPTPAEADLLNLERLNKLADAIVTLQKVVESKDRTIALLTDQIDTLKTQFT